MGVAHAVRLVNSWHCLFLACAGGWRDTVDMTDKPRPQLRNDAQDVTVITQEGSARPVLGTSSPEEQDRRLKVLRHWGAAPSPRAQRLAGIEQPLDQRTQTILSYEVAPELRQRLNGGMGSLAQKREQAAPATVPRRVHGDLPGGD